MEEQSPHYHPTSVGELMTLLIDFMNKDEALFCKCITTMTHDKRIELLSAILEYYTNKSNIISDHTTTTTHSINSINSINVKNTQHKGITKKPHLKKKKIVLTWKTVKSHPYNL